MCFSEVCIGYEVYGPNLCGSFGSQGSQVSVDPAVVVRSIEGQLPRARLVG